MDITKVWLSCRKSRNVNILSSSRIWDFDEIPPPGSAVQTRRIHTPGQISQFHPPGLIMTCRVRFFECCNRIRTKHTQDAKNGRATVMQQWNMHGFNHGNLCSMKAHNNMINRSFFIRRFEQRLHIKTYLPTNMTCRFYKEISSPA